MLEELNDNLQQADGQEQTASIENESTNPVTTESESEVLEVTDTETVSQILEEETSVSAQDEIDNNLAEASQDGSFQDDLEIEIKDYELLSLEELVAELAILVIHEKAFYDKRSYQSYKNDRFLNKFFPTNQVITTLELVLKINNSKF